MQVNPSVEKPNNAPSGATQSKLVIGLENQDGKIESVDLIETMHMVKEARENGTTQPKETSVDAEDVLKGEVAKNVDTASLNRMDGISSNVPLDQLSTTAIAPEPESKEPVLTAQEVLKKESATLLADPVSMDIMDGLPPRGHVVSSDNTEEKESLTTIPLGDAKGISTSRSSRAA